MRMSAEIVLIKWCEKSQPESGQCHASVLSAGPSGVAEAHQAHACIHSSLPLVMDVMRPAVSSSPEVTDCHLEM